MPKPSQKTNSRNAAILVEHLTVAYGDSVVIDDVSFSIEQGEITALIGPNGSGKSTLMRTMLGLVPAQSGTVELLGRHLHEVRDQIGYVPQHFSFDREFPITVAEFMDVARHPSCPETRIRETIEEVGLPLSILPHKLGSLSGGQLQRVLIAQATLNHPSILFLDEAATGIDIVGEAAFYDLIKHLNLKHKTTILLVSHDIAAVFDLVGHVVCVNKKLLCSGPPRLALSERKLSELYGPHAHLYEHHRHPHAH